jgi:hypothetical protein
MIVANKPTRAKVLPCPVSTFFSPTRATKVPADQLP